MPGLEARLFGREIPIVRVSHISTRIVITGLDPVIHAFFKPIRSGGQRVDGRIEARP
jgi:hypothetical protein